jgi:uncharacterized protein
MRRFLIVANRTLGGVALLDAVTERIQAGAAHFRVLVPVGPGRAPDAPDDDLAAATVRLDLEVERLEALGAQVEGEWVEADAYEAVMTAVGRERFDEVILCTLPRGLSRWLRHDLVDRVRAGVDLPVVHISAPAGMPERLTARAVRLTVYVGESDRHGHHPLYTEIVHRARDAGLAGATAVRGLEGFGASQVVHTARLLTMSEDLPMVIHIIDTPDRIEAFLPVLDALITEGLVVREDIDVIKYAGRQPA